MVSITRPSRGERWSATTTRQIGFFLPPTRVSLSLTAKASVHLEFRFGRGGTLAAAGKLLHRRHLPLRHLPHHLLHLAELLDELVHGLHVGAGAPGDPAAARPVEDCRVRALLGRHGGDDRLEPVDLPLVDLDVAEPHAAHAGEHLEDVSDRTHATHLLELLEEVVERELLLADLLLELLGALLVELALGLLGEREDVAHAEDPLRHPVGVEALEGVELLAGRGVEDRLAGDRLDRQRGAAAGVAVELGHDDAVEVRHFGEPLGHVHRVLARHRVDDQEHVVRLRPLLDLRELVHELLVDVQAPGRVHDQDVALLGSGAAERPFRDVDGVASRALLVDGRADLAAHLHKLVDGRRPVDVTGGEGHVEPVLLAQVASELAAGGRLARALQARHEDDRGRLRGENEVAAGAAHELGELLVDQLHDLLPRVERLAHIRSERPFLHRRGEVLDHVEVDVGLEQRQPYLAHRLVDVVLGQVAAAPHVREGALEALGEGVEHVRRRLAVAQPRAASYRAGGGGGGGLSPSRGSGCSPGSAELSRPSACVSSLGMIQTLFDSPCAICGSIWRYWYASSFGSASPSWIALKTVSIAFDWPSAFSAWASRWPSARRIALCFSPSALSICDCL